MNKLVIRRSYSRNLWNASAAILGFAVGILLWSETASSWIGVAIATAAGSYCLVQIGGLFDRRPWLTVSPAGMEFRIWRIGLVPWSSIQRAEIRVDGNDRYLCVRLSDPEKTLSTLTAHSKRVREANRALGLGDIVINLRVFAVDDSQLRESLHHFSQGMNRGHR